MEPRISEPQLTGCSDYPALRVWCNKMATSNKTQGSSITKKRKCVVLTLENKLAILDRLKMGATQEKLASEYGIGRSTVGDLKKSEDKIRSFALTMENTAISTKGRKVMRICDDDKLDEAVYLWFVQKRSQDMPVSGPILCEKASELHSQLHEGESVPPFQASRGWLWRFCQRHGIRQLSLQGEKVSSDLSAIEPFKKELQELLEQEHLTLDQLYNCDETGLLYKMLPSKTLASKSEREASTIKKPKERVTLMTCSNATGMHKLPLVVIGKAENPRCFKNINKKALPVHYYSQKNAWMDTRIFLEWFHNQFVPAVTKYLGEKGFPAKALLLLDNAPSHPDVKTLASHNGNIKALFLPPNTTALFQPMDQGVIESLKRRYRKALLQKLLLEDKEGRSIIQFVKQINMKDVVYMTATAWNDLLPLTFTRSWSKLIGAGSTSEQLSSSDEPNDDEVLKLAHQLDPSVENQDIDDWMDVDCNDEGYQMLSDEDIITCVTQTEQDTEENDDNEPEDEEIQNVPKAGEVKDMLDKCLLWYERQDESTSTSLLLLKQLRDLAAAKRYANLKQLTLDSFLCDH